MSAMPGFVRALSVLVGVLLLRDPALAEVVNLTVQNRQPLANQPQPYEELTGTFRGELDPALRKTRSSRTSSWLRAIRMGWSSTPPLSPS